VRSILDELIAEMAELRAFVASIEPVNAALAGHEDTVVQRYISIRRRFDYAAFAVALYASFEKFVENLTAAYVRLESRRLQYSALPPRLRSKHMTGTAELLSRGRLGEGRYIGMTELSAVRNLFECLNGSTPYTLNEAVVIAHDANLRTSEVDAAFAALGFENLCDRVCRADAMLAWYAAVHDLETPPGEGVKRTVIDERLKDIVERRNQVAHRGGNPVELLGTAAMGDAIEFVDSLSRSIFGMVVGRYLETRYSSAPDRVDLRKRRGDGPFKNGTIVIVEKPPQRLFAGQPVFAIVDSTGARWGRIQSLKIDNADVPSVEQGDAAANGIGVALDFKCPASADLVALASDDDLVWSTRAP
jgi:hypothetical protein